jgi:poly(3-hydroxyalkanoate) synthetase
MIASAESMERMMLHFKNPFLHAARVQATLLQGGFAAAQAAQTYWLGLVDYLKNFSEPSWIAGEVFLTAEREHLGGPAYEERLRDYMELLEFKLWLSEKAVSSSLPLISHFHFQKLNRLFSSWLNTLLSRPKDIADFWGKEAAITRQVVYHYPEAIRAIKPEYGFHFEEDGYVKIAETDRFTLYQVLPTMKSVRVKKTGKPVLIIPPSVLGANILAFLPREGKSYVHAFANQGIPTYVRIVRDIHASTAVQEMTGEDDAEDTRFFCERLKELHSKKITINGFCQGGFVALINILSGVLDGLVDTLITCVSPIDGTRSKSLVEYLNHLPEGFRELAYAEKTLPNGNKVVDGKIMSWVFKLKSMERENPLVTYYRDLMMFDQSEVDKIRISKTAAAINHWLIYDRSDLPVNITKMSFDSYTRPIAQDGTLPVKLFGRELNMKRLSEKGIQTLICYAEQDTLVDRESALAPLEYIDAEVTVFPKGHGALATSWSNPRSEFALHKVFSRNMRGPVRFHLDLDAKGPE